MIEWYVGFHRPCVRNLESRIDPRLWLGHCEIWGYNEDGTWLFLDPQSSGTKIVLTHLYDEVHDQLSARYALCEIILRLRADEPAFPFPLHIPLTCASLIGSITGVRALLPSTLKRKLLAKGAEVVHEQAEGRSGRPAGEAEGAAAE